MLKGDLEKMKKFFYTIKSKLLTIFGDIKIFKFPFFLSLLALILLLFPIGIISLITNLNKIHLIFLMKNILQTYSSYLLQKMY